MKVFLAKLFLAIYPSALLSIFNFFLFQFVGFILLVVGLTFTFASEHVVNIVHQYANNRENQVENNVLTLFLQGGRGVIYESPPPFLSVINDVIFVTHLVKLLFANKIIFAATGLGGKNMKKQPS